MKFQGIPLPPSLNHAYPTNRYGYRFKSESYRAFERDFTVWALMNRKSLREAILHFEGEKNLRLSLDCTFYFKKGRIIQKNGENRKLDIDNRAKPLLDVFSRHLGFDDSAIWKLTLVKKVGLEESCEVEFFKIPDSLLKE